MRIAKTIGIVVGIYLTAMIAEVGMALNSPDYESGISFLVILGILAVLAPRVGYRWFDCFFAVIPIYGVVFIFRVGYRTAFLPNKDWPERAPAE
jgi:hypothetical protein